jgi:glycine cleavage system T protein (aminomethyltransferase)
LAEKTALNAIHREAGAKLVDFAGWEMPLHYGSQIEEHHAVRRAAGMFDVSHMRVVDVVGAGARDFLRRALANDVAKLDAPGRALYSCMLNERGGVVDDLIAYFVADDAYRLVVNAGTAEKDLVWLGEVAAHRPFHVDVIQRPDLALIAVQGPAARSLACAAIPGLEAATAGLRRFQGALFRDWFVARTGYTGEDGFELMLPAPLAVRTWRLLAAAGVRPCGLGARDTLRLEAGMALYGQEMDEDTSPLEAGLAWTVATKTDRDFVGRAALGAPTRALVGLVALDQGVLRAHQAVRTAGGEGTTTSGSFAPTLNRSIALARVPAAVAAGDTVEVEVRGKALRARVVPPPFVRDGKSLIDRFLS